MVRDCILAAAESSLSLTASSWDTETVEGHLQHRRDMSGQPTNGIDSLGPAERDCWLYTPGTEGRKSPLRTFGSGRRVSHVEIDGFRGRVTHFGTNRGTVDGMKMGKEYVP